ncbi:uncharacterized protein LOC143469149 isoform X2 [Clavelina lepadiformis]|uniref:uncharacterized protein LOC143469149 isoform X2 n=1 Tax=Clavelina lepadiformis TaxID=159417 RepID=UPI004043008B
MSDTTHPSLSDSDVPRSPGPLDGSLYAQVKKCRRSGKSPSPQSINRGYYSADELNSDLLHQHSISGSDNTDSFRDKDRSSCEVQTTSDEEDKSPLIKPVTSSALRELDLLRDVNTSVTLTSVNYVVNESRYQTIATAMEESEIRKEEDEEAVVIRDAQVQGDMVTTSPDAGDNFADENTTFVTSQSADWCSSILSSSDEEEHIGGNSGMEDQSEVGRLNACDDINTREVTEDKMIVIRSHDNNMNKLHPTSGNHLTQKDVDNALALVEECLNDHEIRSGSNTPDRATPPMPQFGNLPPCPIAKMDEDQLNLGDDEPQFAPPALPDYPAPDLQRGYEEKGPEYALPVRDVVLGTVPARTAILVSNEPVTSAGSYLSRESESVLDEAIANLVGGAPNAILGDDKVYGTNNTTTGEAPQHKNSVDSGHSLDGSAPMPSTHHPRQTTSCSDVDSGIEVSALSTATKSNRVIGVTTKITSSIDQMMPTNIPFADEEVAAPARLSSEISEFNLSSGTDYELENTISRAPANQSSAISANTVSHPGGSPGVNAEPTNQSENADEVGEEERKVMEEIENTRKRLALLEEQKDKLMKQKENKQKKRHSFDYSASTAPAHAEEKPTHSVTSSTLPRPPGRHMKASQASYTMDSSKKRLSPKEQEDIEELLRSVQDLGLPSQHDVTKVETMTTMMSTALSADPVIQYPHYHDTSPGFKVADPNVAQRANVFTPAYAHPMHHPQHMSQHHYQLQQQKQEDQHRRQQHQEEILRQKQQEEILRQQQQEESRKQEELRRQHQEELMMQRKQEEQLRKQQEEEERLRRQKREQFEQRQQQLLHEQRRVEVEIQNKRQNEFDLQEKKRQEERQMQDKFQQEFEQRQRLLQQEKHKTPLQTLAILKYGTAQDNTDPKPSSSTPVASPTPVFSPPPSSATSTSRSHLTDPVKSTPRSEDLQYQLDELDHYINQLQQTFAVPDEPALPAKGEAMRRRSYSIDVERKKEPAVSVEEMKIPTGKVVSPPRPPSRTRSSFDSVSRRLSHGFELAQLMRQNSMERESRNSSKDDDVFTNQIPQPSYPPQTSRTRPPQQQIAGRAFPERPVPHKTTNVEDKLSPQLFLAMTVNPGARPVEEVHSYKEDLEPYKSNDVVDSALPATPGFPVSPSTPYVNSASSPQGHVPVGLARTPLSALGLKPNPHPVPSIDDVATKEDHLQGRAYLESATKQQALNGNTPVTSQSAFDGSFVTNGSSPTALKQTTLKSLPPAGLVLEDKERQIHTTVTNTRPYHVQENFKGSFTPSNQTQHLVQGRNAQSGGYGDGNRQRAPNGWTPQLQANDNLRQEKELKSPWMHNGGSSPQASTPTSRSPGGSVTFAYHTSSGGASPSSRSLTGSNDSLLSDGSASGLHQTQQPHHAYQQPRYHGSNPSLPPKESSVRNSGSSIRSTSTGSGYLGGTSQTSPQSAGSPVSSSGHYPFAPVGNRRESQLSSYEKQGSRHHHHQLSSDDGGLSSPTSGRTSSSSISDIEKLAHEISQTSLTGAPPKFIRDTTAYWYKPEISREQALAMLRSRPAGSFVVRDSRCYPGAFGLALKVHEVPQAVLAVVKPGVDMNNELVRHFLIEPSTRGVKLKGCANEPVFGSLSALIYQHSITPLALPCKLIIPTENQEVPQQLGSGRNSAEISNSASELLRQGAACNVLYLGSADTESLTGPEAIERAMRECMQNQGQAIKTSIVHFKVSPQGITLTDNARKIFFRRHYPTNAVTYCGMDPSAREPHNRRWDASADRGPPNARVFGFVAKKPGSSVDNVCHLFAEIDLDQPAPAVVNFVSKVLIGPH